MPAEKYINLRHYFTIRGFFHLGPPNSFSHVFIDFFRMLFGALLDFSAPFFGEY
jgi:hypothetical protein